MATSLSSPGTFPKSADTNAKVASARPTEIRTALLTGGFDKPYTFGLTSTLVSNGVSVDVIGSDDVDGPQMHSNPKINFLNLRGSKKEVSLARKVSRVLSYYARLIDYAMRAKPKIFHILWNNKFQFLDRTLLMLYYRILGKKLVLTAHNVNAGKRDLNDSFLNRITLKLQYELSDHIFVHTEKMKRELLEDFGIREQVVTVIPFGINDSVPDTDLTGAEARRQLGVKEDERTILFFGNIAPYKGLEYLVDAFLRLVARNSDYRLIIAGNPKRGFEDYWRTVQRKLCSDLSPGQIIQKICYIPDDETEVYFKAADVVALPYTQVFQSGVLFLAYNFGVPVVATDVGSIREDVIEGETGFLCRTCDSVDLGRAIGKYFESDLFRNLGRCRQRIREYANRQHSWETVGEVTREIYAELLQEFS